MEKARGKRRIIRQGHNCWRHVHAGRAAFLIDAQSYFAAFAAAIEKAKRHIIIIGWDIDSRLRLLRDGQEPDLPAQVGDFLNALVSRRQDLHAYMVEWDSSIFPHGLRSSSPQGLNRLATAMVLTSCGDDHHFAISA